MSGCSLAIDGALSDKPAEGEGAAGPASTGVGATGAMGGGGSGGVAEGGGGAGACAACAPDEDCCDGVCTNLSEDPNNCTQCGMQCQGTLCLNGCSGTCQQAFANCDGNIVTNGCEVEIASDAANCGACGIACPMGAVCTAGMCECAPGAVDCD